MCATLWRVWNSNYSTCDAVATQSVSVLLVGKRGLGAPYQSTTNAFELLLIPSLNCRVIIIGQQLLSYFYLLHNLI